MEKKRTKLCPKKLGCETLYPNAAVGKRKVPNLPGQKNTAEGKT